MISSTVLFADGKRKMYPVLLSDDISFSRISGQTYLGLLNYEICIHDSCLQDFNAGKKQPLATQYGTVCVTGKAQQTVGVLGQRTRPLSVD